MSLSRRDFLAGLGGAGIAYALQIGCAGEPEIRRRKKRPPVWSADAPGIDYRHWLKVEPDGSVTAYTCRVEIGQGFKTALYDVLCQGMELPRERVNVVLGDTDLCPEDGPTTGSAATQYVVWSFWKACPWIQADLVQRAAERLGTRAEDLRYEAGEVLGSEDRALRIGIGELADTAVQISRIDVATLPEPARQYVDQATLNVNGEAIVAGTLQYAGDVYPVGCLYGARLRPELHRTVTRLLAAETSAAAGLPGVVAVYRGKRSVNLVGRSYTAVRLGLAAVEAAWKEPRKPRELESEREIRDRAVLVSVVEEKGRADKVLQAADRVISESYTTQYASQVPIETDTAVARWDGDKATIWTGTQNPLLMRSRAASRCAVTAERIRVVGMPAGGGFGAKAGHTVAAQAAYLSRLAGAPVKCVYSREEQFNAAARYKESVIIDLSTAVGADGRLKARTIDIYQDMGFGTLDVYEIPSVRTRLYRAGLPVKHGVMRGTSYVQVCFAVESHTDALAESVGLDPLEFRRLNVSRASFRPLLDACAEMIGWGRREPPADHGLGVALCNHGGLQLGVVAAEISVDRASGRVRTERLCGAFDIGTVINRNTASAGVKGAMLWGLGYALLEEVKLDGHRSFTSSLADYRIPRFSDTPPIEITFLDNEAPGAPRGCGELPVIPTIGAICNAVYDAIGIRFHRLPITPERVRAALARA